MSKTYKTKSKSKTKTKKKRIFKKKDFSSGDGFLTSVWGPPAWHFLHTISFNYPVNPSQEDKTNYRNFILSLQDVLPCGKCRENLKKNFKVLPLTMTVMKNRETFSRYIYNLHELVNKMLKKKSGLSYCDVRERYEHFRSRCSQNEIPKPINIKEKGCTEPLYGKKSRCILKIVPQENKGESLQIDNKCIKKYL
jgi:hypothetical protein